MNWNDEATKIANWMRDYAADAGSKGFVVGLSGGIDSSVVACLAVRAVGNGNVIGVRLPCQTKEDMNTDAQELANNLGIKLITIDIEATLAELDNSISEALYPYPEERFNTDLTRGNTKARLRMTALYAVANEMNYLVVGTGNKSELKVGYFTKYGDGGVDMEPLGEYFKTEVYKIAEKAFGDAIPKNIMVKAPSADLWGGQTDEQELGMTYEKLDKILKACEPYCIYNSWYADEGIDEESYNKVAAMIKKAYHKNEVPPRYNRQYKGM